jgi:hypothetical protein
MVKKFDANCNFNGQAFPVTLYVGNPAVGSHPLGFQSKWLNKERGGNIPQNVMDSFAKLTEIAEKNRVPFEDLCVYVIEELQSNNELQQDFKRASEFSQNDEKSEDDDDKNS